MPASDSGIAARIMSNGVLIRNEHSYQIALPWRQRVMQHENNHSQEKRTKISQSIANQKKKQIKLSKIIQRYVNLCNVIALP